MSVHPALLLTTSALFAATGQIFFKLGTAGTQSLISYINPRLATGLVLYVASTILWLLGLAKIPLSRAYPFTILTFILVYLGSALFLGERLTLSVIIGAALVLAGLLVVTLGS